MAFFIILLAISQIVSFYLIFNKIKPIFKPKPEGIILKVIPDKPTYELLDPKNKLVYDVMESVKLECWKVEVQADLSYHSKTWMVKFESPTGIIIRSRVRDNGVSYNSSGQIYLSSFSILNSGIGGSVSINNDSKFSDDVIIFLWDYIIEYHQNENDETRNHYQSIIDDISSKLKTLRRSEKLNNILEL
jgi:hypothetical protein